MSDLSRQQRRFQARRAAKAARPSKLTEKHRRLQFKAARQMMAEIAAVMRAFPPGIERQAELGKLGGYRSRGKGGSKGAFGCRRSESMPGNTATNWVGRGTSVRESLRRRVGGFHTLRRYAARVGDITGKTHAEMLAMLPQAPLRMAA